ncbi:type VI secretion system-associated protein TagF [Citreicella sp. C3M06]|uniref:TagF domain-containing protein n=1 Tax=Citreicella sp. C3M06 TaxID=2841564 RepID=UPI001C08CB4D|nr:TagF domain-containing protein [Citreicella sp. C3M06]MBU2961474.1 type VI secretion system-associated protein TagF [Citreicella sp. C3M06]
MAGVFGKLPTQGDFVARGLPPGVQGALDDWVTRHLLPIDAERWPQSGILAALPEALILAVPSCDAVGRAFALCAVTHSQVDQPGADGWAAMTLPYLDAGLSGALDLAALAQALAPLTPPRSAAPLRAPLVWAPGNAPASPEALARLSSS